MRIFSKLYSIQRTFQTLALILGLVVCSTFSAVAASITSTGTGGAWNAGGTWVGGVVPGSGDDVTIASGATVTVPASASCNSLTISGTLNMTGTSITMTITNNSPLVLNSGSSFLIGATNILYFSNTNGGSGITNNGGTIVSTGTNGANGGTINVNIGGGGGFAISGTGTTVINNIDFLQNTNLNISTSNLLVNGKMSFHDNNAGADGSTQYPKWGPGSTLYINNNGQGMGTGQTSPTSPLNDHFRKLWVTCTSGCVVGTTPGYPNNVTLVNMGNSTNPGSGSFSNVGWTPAGTVSLAGTLSIGDGTTAGLASLYNADFTGGGIVVDNNSRLVTPQSGNTFTDNGNFTLTGATTGLIDDGGSTITFAGTGTQTVSTTGGTAITFGGMTVNGTGNYVQLQDPVTVSGTLTLTNGYVGTTNTNILTVNGTVSGGSASSYVDGPLKWKLPASAAGPYKFPVGDKTNSAYLPLTLNSASSASGGYVTVAAFKQNSGGTFDATINAMSNTEYWSVISSMSYSGSPTVSIDRSVAVSPYTGFGEATTSNGVYTAIGGSASGTTMLNGGLGNVSSAYLTLVTPQLSPVKIGGSNDSENSSCSSTNTGSLQVGGVGGTPSYYFSMTSNTGPWDGPIAANGTFTYTGLAAGNYTVWIKDNTATVKSNILSVLGSLQINGNNKNVTFCNTATPPYATLTATNLDNSSATFSWSPGGSTSATITPAPATATTYTVTSTVYSGNLVTNGSFESGTTGWNTDFVQLTSAQIPFNSSPGGGNVNGFFYVTGASNNVCNYYTTNNASGGPAILPQAGSNMLVCDGQTSDVGASGPKRPWYQTVTVVNGATYTFSFYYREANPNGNHPLLQPKINGANLGGQLTLSAISQGFYDPNTWVLATYSWTASSTSAAMEIWSNNSGSYDGNDFLIDNISLSRQCPLTQSVLVTPSCPAPITLISFDAVRQGNDALLTWTTGVEINNSYFGIEKSSDGVHFTEIGQVKGSGNSNGILNYSFVDPSINNGITYYRIVQYDYNGTATPSPVKAVSKNTVNDIQIVPNPSNGLFAVVLDHTGNEKTTLNVLNSLGQVIYESAEFTGNYKEVDLTALASGVYYLQVFTSEGKVVKKVVKE